MAWCLLNNYYIMIPFNNSNFHFHINLMKRQKPQNVWNFDFQVSGILHVGYSHTLKVYKFPYMPYAVTGAFYLLSLMNM